MAELWTAIDQILRQKKFFYLVFVAFLKNPLEDFNTLLPSGINPITIWRPTWGQIVTRLIVFIYSILPKLRLTRFISTLDIKSAYWHVELNEERRHYTAFTVSGKDLYRFARMAYGLTNVPATFQRLVNVILIPE